MNNAFFLARNLCFPALLLFSGCLEEHVRTAIAPDGSSERTISMKLSTRELPGKAFPIPRDSSWNVAWNPVSEKDAKFEYVATKRFAGPEELRNEYAGLPDSGILGIRIDVGKRFEWFFSYLEYNETYVYRNPFGNVPVGDYLSKEEIARFVAGEKSDSLKHKVDRWTMRDMFEEIYRPLLAETKRMNNSAFSAGELEARKEELFALVVTIDSLNSKKKGPDSAKIGPVEEKLDSAESIVRLLVKFFHTEAAYALRPAVQLGWNSVASKLERMKYPDGWVSSVQMPGLIVEANSNTIEANTITWKFEPGQIQVGDYAMHAVSRVTNVWAIILTGVVALAALLRIVFSRRR